MIMTGKDTIKIIKMVGIVVSIILFTVAMCEAFGSVNYNKKIDTSQQEIKDAITKDMRTYLSEYKGADATKVASLDQRVTVLENDNGETVSSTTLTDAQTQVMIKSITNQIKPELLKEIASRVTTMEETTIKDLESQIETIVKENTKEAEGLTSEDILEITNQVQLIVEANIMQEVAKNYSVLEANIKSLKTSIEEKISNMETTISNYETRIKQLETTISDIEKNYSKNNINASSNIQEVKNSLTILEAEYNQFLQTALSTSHIVNVFDVEPTDDKGVLSAKAGYAMYKELSKRISQLNTSVSGELEANMEDMKNRVSTLETITETQATAINEAKTSIKNSENAITKNEAAISQASSDISALEIEKDNLQAAISNMDSLSTKINNAKSDDLDQYIANLSALKETFTNEADQAQIETVITQIKKIRKLQESGTATADDLLSAKATLQNNIDTAKASLNEQLSSVNTNISDLQKSIAEANSSIEANKQNIESANSSITENKDAINENKTSIQQNTDDISSLQNDMNNLQNAVQNKKSAEVDENGNLVIYVN